MNIPVYIYIFKNCPSDDQPTTSQHPAKVSSSPRGNHPTLVFGLDTHTHTHTHTQLLPGNSTKRKKEKKEAKKKEFFFPSSRVTLIFLNLPALGIYIYLPKVS